MKPPPKARKQEPRAYPPAETKLKNSSISTPKVPPAESESLIRAIWRTPYATKPSLNSRLSHRTNLQHWAARTRASEESARGARRLISSRAYEAHGAEKTVLRGSQTTEAKLPAVGACARSRHAGIYARRTQRHFSRSQDYESLCKWTRGLTRLSGRNSGNLNPNQGILSEGLPGALGAPRY